MYVNNPWVIYFLLGLLISLGHAPISDWPASILGLAVFFALRAKVDKPLKLCFKDGWWLGFGYFLGTLNWIIEPFLIDIVAHGWMAPFAVVFMSAGLALFWGMGLAFGSILGGKLGFVIGLGIFDLRFNNAYAFCVGNNLQFQVLSEEYRGRYITRSLIHWGSFFIENPVFRYFIGLSSRSLIY